jgi:type III secretory pathway component EscS
MLDLILSYPALVAMLIVGLAWGAVDAAASLQAQRRAAPVRVRRR